METLIIQIIDNKAFQLLEDLEALNVIKILDKKIQTKQKLSEKYAGKLPSQVADQLQEYITRSRNEWNNPNI